MEPIKRAIVLVPGFEKRAQGAARDQLVTSILNYTDGYKTSTSDVAAQNGTDYVTIRAEDRGSDYAAVLDVYEAFWGDLVPDWSQESPWQRFRRGFLLIGYWAAGGLFKSLARGEMPTKTVGAMTVAAAALLFWYFIVITILVQAIGASDASIPAALTEFLTKYQWVQAIFAKIQEMGNWSVTLILIGLIGIGALEGMANVSSFVKAYLRDDPMGEDTIGLRAKSRQRVLSMLDHVNAEGQQYEEVYVVAHSLGGAIAIDALAEYGTPLPKTVLHTWGSAMGLLVQQEALVEIEIAKLYDSKARLANWIDVVFSGDMMASPCPVPRIYDGMKRTKKSYAPLFPDTLVPPMPKRMPFSSEDLHQGYFRCERAMLMLVAPMSDLPQRVPEIAGP